MRPETLTGEQFAVYSSQFEFRISHRSLHFPRLPLQIARITHTLSNSTLPHPCYAATTMSPTRTLVQNGQLMLHASGVVVSYVICHAHVWASPLLHAQLDSYSSSRGTYLVTITMRRSGYSDASMSLIPRLPHRTAASQQPCCAARLRSPPDGAQRVYPQLLLLRLSESSLGEPCASGASSCCCCCCCCCTPWAGW